MQPQLQIDSTKYYLLVLQKDVGNCVLNEFRDDGLPELMMILRVIGQRNETTFVNCLLIQL